MTQAYITLAERKAAQVAALAAAVARLRPLLAERARALGGRYLLHGSAASGTMRYDSDVDLLLDFPPETEAEAWRFAEDACWDLGLKPDVVPLAMCSAAFHAHVVPKAVILG